MDRGFVTGLAGPGLVLRNNGGDDLAISADGPFTFPTTVATGSPYAVTVASEPSVPVQSCMVSNAAGTAPAQNVTDVLVRCETAMTDLQITKTDNQAQVPVGTTLTYTIVVRNNGPLAVVGAQVEDLLPAELINATWQCVPSTGAACTWSRFWSRKL